MFRAFRVAIALAASVFTFQVAGAGVATVEWELQAIRDAVAEDGKIMLRGLPLRSDLSVDLKVETFSLVGPNTRFLSGLDGQIEFDPSSIVLLRGEVVGRPGSHVFLALHSGSSTGYVDLGPGHRRYRISSHPTDRERLSVFRAVSPPTLPPDVPPWTCRSWIWQRRNDSETSDSTSPIRSSARGAVQSTRSPRRISSRRGSR